VKKLEWTDHTKDWADIKPGWYTHTIKIPNMTASEFENWYTQVVNWIYSIDNCEKHCRWILNFPIGRGFRGISIKFRYERDYLLCVLRW